MNTYYAEKKLKHKSVTKRDFVAALLVVCLSFGIYLCKKNVRPESGIKVIQPYYLERYHRVPSKDLKFGDSNYDTVVSFLPLNDRFRKLKYKLKDLNKTMGEFEQDLSRHQAMTKIISALEKVKSGEAESVDISALQQSVLEAGFGNVEAKLLQKALDDYDKQVKQNRALRLRIEKEKRELVDKMEKDAKDTGIFAMDIAKEIAEDEIEGFIEKLSLIARVGNFVINKVK